MKKIFLLMFVIFLIPSFPFAAESEDMSVYLRKDVFDAKMEAFMSEIRLMNEQLRSDIKALDSKIDKVNETLNARIEATNSKIDSVDAKLSARIADLHTAIYWGLGIFGLFIAFSALAPALGEFFGRFRRPLPDFEAIVRRLIEENNAKLEKKFQPLV